METTLTLTPAQKKALEEANVDVDELVAIPGKKLHSMVFLPDAWSDGKNLVFFGTKQAAEEKFLYYMGAERDNEHVLRTKDMSVYVLGEDRLPSYM